jgi:hypothetical protein
MGDLEPRVSVGSIIARSALTQLPVLGPIVNEILNEVLPNRRIERLTALFERLEERVERLHPKPAREQFERTVFVDLLEDGMFQAARATGADRTDQIAALLANSVSATDRETISNKFLLHLLGQLNDVEVLLLVGYGKERPGRDAFFQQHESVFDIEPAHLGASREVIDRETVHKSFKSHLASLVLIRKRHNPTRGKLPEFDNHGQLKGGYFELSPLGRLLLRLIDQPSDLDR